MDRQIENILLVAGSGRNCGKTSFLCDLLQNLNVPELTAVKITPHFHVPTEGLILLNKSPNFHIYREENRLSDKDSSRFLQAGASSSYYIQTKDSNLLEAFRFLLPFLENDKLIVVESAALARFVKPALFVFIQKKNENPKGSAESILKLVDQVIFSDGKSFSISPTLIIFEKTWKIKRQ